VKDVLIDDMLLFLIDDAPSEQKGKASGRIRDGAVIQKYVFELAMYG
jgi:hypothetical protein